MTREHSKKGTEKHLNSQCKQCTRELWPKEDGTEARVPVGVYRNCSTVAKVTKERIVLEKRQWSKTGGEKGGKGNRKVAKVRPEFAGVVGKQDTGKLRQGELEQESERCGRGQRRHE